MNATPRWEEPGEKPEFVIEVNVPGVLYLRIEQFPPRWLVPLVMSFASAATSWFLMR